MNHLKFGCVALLAILLSGCAPQRMYDWGDYSSTLYQSKKHPSSEADRNHLQSLEKIIEESKKTNLRIPPGVYAELGYIYFRQNKKDLAISNFKMEKELYPESTLLMDRLESSARLADKPRPSESNTQESSPVKTDNLEKK
jgi:hypothetical protein